MQLAMYDSVNSFSPVCPDVKVDCPKCKSECAWYERDDQDVRLRCICGYCKVVATRLEEMVIEHIDRAEDVSLPRQGTKLWNCLMVLFSLEKGNSQEITDLMNRTHETTFTVSDISSQLTVLRYKGLVDTTDARKGFAGGSTWIMTEVAKKVLGA